MPLVCAACGRATTKTERQRRTKFAVSAQARLEVGTIVPVFGRILAASVRLARIIRCMRSSRFASSAFPANAVRAAGMVTALLLSAIGLNAAEEPAARPNIIAIMTDDHGWGDTGYNGNSEVKTPSLDRLAASGVRFDNGYVTAPQCIPSRAGIILGRHQQRYGLECNPDEKYDGTYQGRTKRVEQRTAFRIQRQPARGRYPCSFSHELARPVAGECRGQMADVDTRSHALRLVAMEDFLVRIACLRRLCRKCPFCP